MRLLKMAIKRKRWDLAAHTIVLAAAIKMENGEKPDGRENREKKRRSKG